MYYVSVEDSIIRILRTPLGSRVMLPDFGSRLHELRDRDFNEEYKLDATKYIYESVEKYEPRVEIDKVDFRLDPKDGVVYISLVLSNGEVLEIRND